MGEVQSHGYGGKRASSEGASQSSALAPTQVFDLSDHVRSVSQADVAATQIFDAPDSRQSNSQTSDVTATQVFDVSNSRRQNSQTDLVATQVFNAPSATQEKPRISGNSQTDLVATQVFDPAGTVHQKSGVSPRGDSLSKTPAAKLTTPVLNPVTTVQQKSGGSPGNSRSRNSDADILPTQMFCEPAAVTTKQRSSGASPHTTVSASSLPRQSSDVPKDSSRVSFSPQSYSTQDFPSETNFPHLALEMSECNDSHGESDSGKPTAVAARFSFQQVIASFRR